MYIFNSTSICLHLLLYASVRVPKFSFARCQPRRLSLPSCLRQAEGVSDFEWSPKDNVLAYWAPEQANAPARVSVVEIPSRKELRQKNLVMVSECRLHWQVRTYVDGV